jgi:hypothetical protein
MKSILAKPFKTVYANSLDAYIPELWAQESVAILVENMVIANLVHRDFSNEVAKFGDIVHTRKPATFTAKRKTNTDSVTVQDASATDIQVPLDQHFHTSFMIMDGEESKSFKSLRDEYLQPAVQSLSRAIDLVLLGESHQFYQNAEGIAGGLTTSNLIQYLVQTRKRMNINKAPEDGRNLILTPTTEATALQISTFHEADKVGDAGTAMREASLGRKFQFNMFMCQNAPSTVGAPVTASQPLIDLAAGYPVGTTVIHVDTAGSALKVGDWIKVGGVLHRVTALGTLSTEDIDVTISPGLRVAVADDDPVTIGSPGLVNLAAGYSVGYAKEIVVDGITGAIPVGTLCSFATPGTPNVLKGEIYSVIATTESGSNTIGITLNKPLDVALADDDVIDFSPPAEHNFAFHRNALALVSRPLAPAPAGLALSSVASANGVGVRVTMTYNGSQQGVLVTVDVLCGIQILDLNLGALLIG